MNKSNSSLKMTLVKIANSLKASCKRLGHWLLDFLIHQPRKLATILVSGNALTQLALSQTHIGALIRVRLTVGTLDASNYTAGMPSTGIGMFNFLFILFGLVAIFNVIRATSRIKMAVALLSLSVAVGFGVVFYLQLTNPDNVVDYLNIVSSVRLMSVAFILYGVAMLVLLYGLIVPSPKRGGSL
jgi:hypothetical protein